MAGRAFRLAGMAAVCASGLAVPSAAQTVEDAARANVALAVGLCVLSAGDPAAAVQRFTAAGFAYSTRGTPGVEVWHVFTAPAVTARAEVYEGQMAPSCEVSTNHLPPAAAAPLVGSVLGQAFPGRFAPSGPGSQSCASFTDARPAIPFMVVVGATDRSDGCPGLGSTSITVFSAV